MKKHFLAVLLVAVTLIAVGLIAVACAPSGGNGGSPCCDATGTTDQPPPFNFVGGVAPTLQAQAIVFNGSACTTLDANGNIVNPASDFRVVGGPVAVVSTSGAAGTFYGRYDLTVDQSAIGQQVYIEILGSAGVPQAIGFFPVTAATSLASGSYHVAPIRRPPGINGDSTTRAALLCWMQDHGVLGGATSLEVREAVTPDDTAAILGTAAFPSLAGLVGAVAAAGQHFEGQGGGVLQQDLHRLRELAEASVDACRDGNALDPASGIACQVGNDVGAEFYRGWTYAWGDSYIPTLSALPLPELTVAYADELELHAPPVGTAPSPFGYARRAEALRLEGVAAGINRTVKQGVVGIPGSNLNNATALLINLRQTVLTAAGTPQVAAGASSDGALVIQQLASGNLGADTSCVLTSPAGGGIFNAAQADVGNTEIGLKQNSAGTATVGSILFDYFGTPPPTTVQGALDGNLNQCATLSGAPLKRQAWAHIFTLTGLPTFAR